MNIVTFNEPFEHAIAAWTAGQPELRAVAEVSSLPFKNWQTSPLFNYATLREKEQKLIKSMLESDFKLETCPWPFETFRLSMVERANEKWDDPLYPGQKFGGGHYRADFVVTRHNEHIYMLANVIRLFDETPQTLAIARKHAPMIVYIGDVFTTLDNPDQYQYKHAIFSAGRWFFDIESTTLFTIDCGLMDSLAGFILDSIAPNNRVAEVRPAVNGHTSVEWVKARTHYTLITHDHPANSKDVAERARVNQGSADEQMKRMAHARRAHFKTLKHPRYRFALNEQRFAHLPKGTIFVKQAWVGPKEWMDEGGRQIYKILEPIDE